jgi:hypothetical protein
VNAARQMLRAVKGPVGPAPDLPAWPDLQDANDERGN